MGNEQSIWLRGSTCHVSRILANYAGGNAGLCWSGKFIISKASFHGKIGCFQAFNKCLVFSFNRFYDLKIPLFHFQPLSYIVPFFSLKRDDLTQIVGHLKLMSDFGFFFWDIKKNLHSQFGWLLPHSSPKIDFKKFPEIFFFNFILCADMSNLIHQNSILQNNICQHDIP